MTISPFLSKEPTQFVAFFKKLMSGCFCLSIGVGTVTMKILQSFMSSSLFVNFKYFDFFISSLVISRVVSKPSSRFLILVLFVSKPVTLNLSPNSIANGNPTYPRPIIAILVL